MLHRCGGFTALVLMIALAGCAAQKGEPAQTESGLDGAWHLVAGQVDGQPFPNGAQTTLVIVDGEFHGRATCNQYGGALAVGQDRWRITKSYATEMGCWGLRAVSERSYFAALWAVTTARRDGGDALTLRGGHALLKFRSLRG